MLEVKRFGSEANEPGRVHINCYTALGEEEG